MQREQSDAAQRRRRARQRKERTPPKCRRCGEPMPGAIHSRDYCHACRPYRYMGYQLRAAQLKAERIGETGIAADIAELIERLDV